MEKIIFHLDLDAFFCSVEELDNPVLKTIPFAISTNKNKSVISTANYLARKYNICSAMKCYDAKKMCPEIVLIKPNFEKYITVSKKIVSLLKNNFTNKIECTGLDECYLDVTEILKNYHNNPLILAKQIQQLIFKKTNLSISIGISNSKVIAKIATDLNKPHGITTLFHNQRKEKLLPLNILCLPGIGKKRKKELDDLNIVTVKNFVDFSNQLLLQKIFGSQYYQIINIISGDINDNIVDEIADAKSISKTYTLIDKENELERIYIILEKVSKSLISEINWNLIKPRCVILKIKYNHHYCVSKSHTMNDVFITKNNLLQIAKIMFLELWNETEITAVSLSVSKF